MKNNFYYLAISFAILCVIQSCSKSDSSVSKTELISKKVWKFTGAQQKNTTNTWVDIFGFYMPCSKDDLYTFSANGKFYSDYGSLKCSTSEPQIDSSKIWNFTDNETKILVSVPPSTTSQLYEIIQLDEQTFIYQLGNSIKVTLTH
jgi:hypothetical protein